MLTGAQAVCISQFSHLSTRFCPAVTSVLVAMSLQPPRRLFPRQTGFFFPFKSPLSRIAPPLAGFLLHARYVYSFLSQGGKHHFTQQSCWSLQHPLPPALVLLLEEAQQCPGSGSRAGGESQWVCADSFLPPLPPCQQTRFLCARAGKEMGCPSSPSLSSSPLPRNAGH